MLSLFFSAFDFAIFFCILVNNSRLYISSCKLFFKLDMST